MFDFKKVEKPEKLNKTYILSKLSDAQIFYFYHGEFRVGAVYSSRFRKDRRPSCGFYLNRSGILIYRDLAGKDQDRDCFAFVQRMFNCSFAEAIRRIAGDFGLVTGKTLAAAQDAIKKAQNFDKEHKKETKIHFRAGKWYSTNLLYWDKRYIDKDELKKNGVYVIDALYVNEKFIPNRTNAIRYALTEIHNGEMLTKVYCPENKSFLSNIPIDIPFGLADLKPGDKSFTTKGVKERIIIRKFIPENVLATQNESEGALPPPLVKRLIKDYKTNYLGWDNDLTGLEAAAPFEEKGFILANLPAYFLSTYGLKDYDNLCEEYGPAGVETFLKGQNII